MIESRKSRRQDQGSDLVGQNLRFLIKVDGFGGAGSAALLAFLLIQKQTVKRIYHVA
jgi:hypothetical protein